MKKIIYLVPIEYNFKPTYRIIIFLESNSSNTWLSAAEKISNDPSFPIPGGIPWKSSSFSFKYNLRKRDNLQRPEIKKR